MALSQKHDGKCLVPWFCSAEWHLVYNKIFGSNNNDKTRKEALDIMNIWKARTPFLFCGIEGTYMILEALLLDRSAHEIYNLKLLLSTSIMRFLNICAAYDKNEASFYKTARKMKIPFWIINIRHNFAHGQNLSSIDVLDRALKFSLEWVHQEYWLPSAPEIKDFIDETQFASDKTEALKNSLQPLVSNYCYITLVGHSNWNYIRVEDISDEELRNVFLEEIKSMIDSDDIDETTELCKVLENLWQNIAEILKEYGDLENRYQVLAELLLEDVFLGNIDNREDIFKDTEKVPDDFIYLWENMLLNFNTHMLGALIEQLLQVLKENVGHERKIVATTWILKIAKGLEKSLFINSIIKKLNSMGPKPKRVIEETLDEQLKTKYKKHKILNLNSNLEIPEVISDCSKFKTFVLEVPSQYTKMFIYDLLDLNSTYKLQKNRQQILELINIYVPNEDTDEETVASTKIHNVEEFLAMEVDDQPVEEIKENFADIVTEKVSVTESSNSNKVWRRVTETNFEKCPIGILPWQSSSVNPLLA